MEGSALPPYLFQPISETISKTISEDIWPALHRALKPFIYDGVKIPSHCGIRPDSAKFHFDGGRIGVSVLLDLDNFAKNYCIHHLKTNLPKISVIDTSRINSSLVSWHNYLCSTFINSKPVKTLTFVFNKFANSHFIPLWRSYLITLLA